MGYKKWKRIFCWLFRNYRRVSNFDKENNEVSLNRVLIFNDNNFVNNKCVEYSSNINNNSNINVHRANKDYVLKHKHNDQSEENKIMENQLEPNNEIQQVEQENETNVKSYPTNLASWYVEKPKKHLTAVKYILKYLKGNINYGVVI